ncbi:MAG: GNAT family N-acetyltransferase [Chloroflexota bacterium]
MTNSQPEIRYLQHPLINNEALNALFAVSWPNHSWCDFQPVLNHSLDYICGYAQDDLIGFVNLAWDGGIHAFVLDTTVHPNWRRRGIGQALVRTAAKAAQEHGIQWLHVDYEPHLDKFYQGCGFRPTLAGLIDLQHPIS